MPASAKAVFHTRAFRCFRFGDRISEHLSPALMVAFCGTQLAEAGLVIPVNPLRS